MARDTNLTIAQDVMDAAEQIVDTDFNDGLDTVSLVALGIEYGRAQATIEAPPAESEFARRMREELASARECHEPIRSFNEGHAVILEEFLEFQECVFQHSSQCDPSRVLSELIRTAAMCQRTAEDCGLIKEALK